MNRAPWNARLGLATVCFLASCAMALAGSHTWRVTEIFSNADGTIQFIELQECCGFAAEGGVIGSTLSSGQRNYVIPGPAIGNTSNRHLLFATPAFAALPGVPTPNYVFPAGSVPFFTEPVAPATNFVRYSVYSTLTFAAGQLPRDGVRSLHMNRSTGVITVGCNSPTNYAGVTGSVNLGCSLRGDVNGSGARDGEDIAGFVRVKLGLAGPGDNVACAEYCTGSLAGDVSAFVTDMLS